MAIAANKPPNSVLSFLMKALNAYFGMYLESQKRQPYSTDVTDGVDETEANRKKSIIDEDYFWLGCGCGWH